MTEDKRSQLQDAGDRELLAIRRAERNMAAEERGLAQKLDDFEKVLEHAEHTIEAEVRTEHWGHEPERRLSWRAGSHDS